MLGSIASKRTKHHTAVEQMCLDIVPPKWAECTVKSNAKSNANVDHHSEALLQALTPSYVIDFAAPAIEYEYVIERSVGQAEEDEAAGVLFMDEDVDLIWISESDRIELDDPKSWMPWDGQCDDFILDYDLRKKIMKWDSQVGRSAMMNYDDVWYKVQITKVHRSENGIITVDVKGKDNGRRYDLYGLELDLLKPL